MFTVFINTDKNLDIGRHAPLIDDLRASGELLVLESPIEELRDCAKSLAGQITWDDRFGEEYNIIVFAEAEGRNENALASELFLTLCIEDNLFEPLYELGRKPKEAVILFGENFDRGWEYSTGQDSLLKVQQSFWELFPVPEQEKARSLLVEVQGRFERRPELENEFAKAFVQAITGHQSEKAHLLSDSEFVQSTLEEVALSVFREEAQSVDLPEELYHAVENQRENVRKAVTGEKPRCAYIRLLDSDVNAKSRSVYRILLFISLAAVKQSILLQDLTGKTGEHPSPANLTIPEVNWDEVAGELAESRRVLEQELRHLENREDPFPQFNRELIEGALLPLELKMPQLFLKVIPRIGMTVRQLRAAASRLIGDVRQKSRDNDSRINTYITRLTEQFNRDKDQLMGSLRYRDESANIETETLAGKFIQKEQEKADIRIVAKKRLSPPAVNMEAVLKLAERRLEYCFSCMKTGRLVPLTLLVFLLLFAVPYLIINREFREMPLGWLYFAATILILALAFCLGSLLFFLHCKRRILAELTSLSETFTRLQKEKEEILASFTELIRHDIPLSYCLELYRREFEQHRRRGELGATYVTFHKNQLRQYSQYVIRTLSELGFAGQTEESSVTERYESMLLLDRDQFQNDAVYRVIDKSRIEACLLWDNGGAQI